LCTELGSHQIQVADWMFRGRVERVSGSGSISYWRDGREVPDHVALVYDYSDGRKHIWDSMSSNRYYGCEEQIMGDKGTIEAEIGDFYQEGLPPTPGLQRLIRDVTGGVFNKLPLGGSSYQGELKSRAVGEAIVSRHPPPVYEEGVHQIEAFIAAIRAGQAQPGLLPFAFNATVAALMGEQTALTGESQNWPEMPDLIEGALA
jgi:predicted dehydrogenase